YLSARWIEPDAAVAWGTRRLLARSVCRNLRDRRYPILHKTVPETHGHQAAEADERDVGHPEAGAPEGQGVIEAIRVQADPELVRSEPGPGGDHIANKREKPQSALFNHAAPASVQDQRVPDD